MRGLAVHPIPEQYASVAETEWPFGSGMGVGHCVQRLRALHPNQFQAGHQRVPDYTPNWGPVSLRVM